MAFDNLAQRYAMVDLDLDGDGVAGFANDWASLMTTGWGEDITVAVPPPPYDPDFTPTGGVWPMTMRAGHFAKRLPDRLRRA